MNISKAFEKARGVLDDYKDEVLKEEKKLIVDWLMKLHGQYHDDQSIERNLIKNIAKSLENDEHVKESR